MCILNFALPRFVPSGQHRDLVPVRQVAPSPLESTLTVTKPASHFD